MYVVLKIFTGSFNWALQLHLHRRRIRNVKGCFRIPGYLMQGHIAFPQCKSTQFKAAAAWPLVWQAGRM